jgi:hypothetical protein
LFRVGGSGDPALIQIKELAIASDASGGTPYHALLNAVV